MSIGWTANKVTFLRVVVGFLAVCLFGGGAWANLTAVGLTVAAIALDAVGGHLARKKQTATPVGAQLDILGDRMIENVYFTYFAVVGMVSLWVPVLFFARGAATDFLRGLAMKAGHSGWGARAMLETWWGQALVASRWSRGLYAAMKCLCFCYLGLELALTRGSVALVGQLAADVRAMIRAGAYALTWMTAAFCLLRGLPVLVEGWKYLAGNAGPVGGAKSVAQEALIKEIREKGGGVAAFFDLDGTLVARPSLEKRFFRMLRNRRAIPARNYLLWLREAMRLMPRGIGAILQANKVYLRGVEILDEHGEGDPDGQPAEGQPRAAWQRNPRQPVPVFLAPAIEKVAWHANQGHQIVLVSGTLLPLARRAASAMEAELAARGITVTIRVLATRLEELDGRWTGRILGPAMFGEAKARAARRRAEEMRLDLGRCYAYGDSLNDRWLLAAVGRPTAVNPSKGLGQMAKKRGWPTIEWKDLTPEHSKFREKNRQIGGWCEREKHVSPLELKERAVNAPSMGRR